MKDYSKSKIYKIVCNETGLIYIGSTTQQLSKRLMKHRSQYKAWLQDNKKYMSSYKILENGNYNIILIEECPCENSEQLRKKERQYIDNIDCVNIVKKPFVSIEENKERIKKWINDNIDKIKEYNKEYYNDNIDKIKEYKKEYYKKWYNDNIDKIKEYNKEWYNDNKDTINEKRKEKIECEICSSIIRKSDLSKHLKTIKCQSFLKNLNI